jgi:hypothetical protein
MKTRSYNSRLAVEALEGRTMMSAVSHGEYNDGREAAALSVLALVAPAQGAAVERPYVSRGTAQFALNGSDFAGAGTATHLGRYTEAGSATFSPTADPTVLQVDAQSTYTAANGDQLFAVFSGQLNGVTGTVTATVTYVGGTGRFASASGTATFSGRLLPGGAIEASVQGTIKY